jgi:hypothetical protein
VIGGESSAIAWIAMVTVAGCGRIYFEPVAADAPAANDDAGCTFTPWTNVVAQAALNGASDEWEPALSPDGLSIAFVSYTGTAGLYAATRPSRTVAFALPRMLAELSTASVEHGPAWSGDGSKLYFTRESGPAQPMEATYLGNATFASPTNAALPTNGHAYAVSADELEVFMTNEQASDQDLGHATRTTTASPWQLDTLVDGFNRVGPLDGFPALDEARGDLYYAYETGAGTDAILVVAHRAQRGASFGPAEPVSGLEVTGAITGDPSLTADGLTLAFASTRPGGAGASDIYLATRTCD